MIPPRLGLGFYDFPQAAQYTRLNTATVRRWFVPPANAKRTAPILEADFAPLQGHYAISFLDMIDLYVFGHLRKAGMSLAALRRVFANLQRELGEKHAFAHARLATEGRELLLRAAGERDREELSEVLSRRKAFATILAPFFKRLEYDATTRLARLWRIGDGVIINPEMSLGRPLVDGVFIKTDVLACAYHANKRDANDVARWYNVAPKDVMTAVRFESGLAV